MIPQLPQHFEISRFETNGGFFATSISRLTFFAWSITFNYANKLFNVMTSKIGAWEDQNYRYKQFLRPRLSSPQCGKAHVQVSNRTLYRLHARQKRSVDSY